MDKNLRSLLTKVGIVLIVFGVWATLYNTLFPTVSAQIAVSQLADSELSTGVAQSQFAFAPYISVLIVVVGALWTLPNAFRIFSPKTGEKE